MSLATTLRPPGSSLPFPSHRYELGGLKVSPFCLGMTEIEDLRHAFSLGFNFFFLSADMHWPLYRGTRRALARLLADGVPRSEIVVACVSYVTQPEFCTEPFRELVAAIPGLGHLDIAVIGGVYPDNFLARHAIYRAHREEHFEGIRALGATLHDRSVAVTLIDGSLVDLCFVRYNADHYGAEHDVFPFATQRPRPLLYAFKSTGGHVADATLDAVRLPEGKWRPTVPDHYRFVLSQRDIDGVLCALTSNAEVDALCAAVQRGALSPEEHDYLKGLAHLGSGRAQLRT